MQEHEINAEEQELENNKHCCRGSGIHCPSSWCERELQVEGRLQEADGRPSKPAKVLPKLVVFQSCVLSCTSLDTGGIMSCCLGVIRGAKSIHKEQTFCRVHPLLYRSSSSAEVLPVTRGSFWDARCYRNCWCQLNQSWSWNLHPNTGKASLLSS